MISVSCHPRFFCLFVFWKTCHHQSVICQMLCFVCLGSCCFDLIYSVTSKEKTQVVCGKCCIKICLKVNLYERMNIWETFWLCVFWEYLWIYLSSNVFPLLIELDLYDHIFYAFSGSHFDHSYNFKKEEVADILSFYNNRDQNSSINLKCWQPLLSSHYFIEDVAPNI